MKVHKFNETSDYKEYDTYASINIDVITNWGFELNKIDSIVGDIRHDIHRYNDFIKEYVVFTTKYSFFIPSSISYDYVSNAIYFEDVYKNIKRNIIYTDDIISIDDIANEDPLLFMKLYNFYIIEKKAPYMDVFGKDEYKHILDSKKYNL